MVMGKKPITRCQRGLAFLLQSLNQEEAQQEKEQAGLQQKHKDVCTSEETFLREGVCSLVRKVS
jgi:hypothetical protein